MPANKTYILGLTGGIGCGKSAAAAYLKQLGAAHIDADAIAHSLTAENGEALPEIRKKFSAAVFDSEGRLDRAALAHIVFSDPEKKSVLESIVHPMVKEVILNRIKECNNNGVKVAVLDVPLLFESGLDGLCDEVWAMSVPADVQLQRVCERDNTTPEAAARRIAGQMSLSERNARADRVIDSDHSFEDTQAELMKLYRELQLRIS